MPRRQRDGKSSQDTTRGELCRLPIEVLSTIASFCTKSNLCSLARTCQLLCKISLKALHYSVLLDAGLFIRLARLGEGFKHASLQGMRWLEQIRCLTAYINHSDFDYKYAMETIEKMKYLRHMLVMYDLEHFVEEDPLHFPSTFPETLTSCK